MWLLQCNSRLLQITNLTPPCTKNAAKYISIKLAFISEDYTFDKKKPGTFYEYRTQEKRI